MSLIPYVFIFVLFAIFYTLFLVFAKHIDLNTEITTDDLETRMKLLHFRSRALKDRLGGFWSSSEELVRKVAASISFLVLCHTLHLSYVLLLSFP